MRARQDFWSTDFPKKTFTAMIAGVREPAISAGFIEQQTFDRGIEAARNRRKQTAISATRSSKRLRQRAPEGHLRANMSFGPIFAILPRADVA